MLIPTRAQRLAQKKTEPPPLPVSKYPPNTTPQPPTTTIRLSANEWKILTGQQTYMIVRQPKVMAYCAVCGTYSDGVSATAFHSKCGPHAVNLFPPRQEFFDCRQPLLNTANNEVIWLLKPGMREKVGGTSATPKSQSQPQS
jgi:hypothetical protein